MPTMFNVPAPDPSAIDGWNFGSSELRKFGTYKFMHTMFNVPAPEPSAIDRRNFGSSELRNFGSA
jgi:hypothetical protein